MKRFIVAILAFLMMSVAFVAPAEAHFKYYCGHGLVDHVYWDDGRYEVHYSKYMGVNRTSGRHFHEVRYSERNRWNYLMVRKNLVIDCTGVHS